jgi:hypothetical protein
MTDEFLTEGLENDRYHKARQLIKQFDKEIKVKLRAIGDEMAAQNRDLFDESVDGDENISRMSQTFPHARIDYPMDRISSREDDNRLKLNVHLYWDDPRNYNRTDIEGTLRALGYKIKNISETDEQPVVIETSDWPIQTAENRFGDETAFYNHVNSAADIDETGEQLVEHFSTFGDEYGVPRDAYSGN